MSQNKQRFYKINTTTIIRANNQQDAIDFLYGADNGAQMIDHQIKGSRILATDAKRELGTSKLEPMVSVIATV